MKSRIAIIGAGISGLTLANQLKDYGEVTVFEKARGVGGRMSTRYADPYNFDHGTQFFTARSKSFKTFLAPHIASGLVQEWQGKVITLNPDKKTTDRLWFEPHYVALPNMNNLCKQLSENITVIFNCEIAPMQAKTNNGWQLFDKQGLSHGDYDWVISTAPAEQTCLLFATFLPEHSIVAQSNFLPCYALMLGFERQWNQSWIAAQIMNSPLGWISVNSSKPNRDKGLTSLVAHSDHAWTQDHLADDRQEVEFFLRETLQPLLQFDISQPNYCALHLWRYALLDRPPNSKRLHPPFCDQENQLASAGDWCSDSRIEEAWLNAMNLAGTIAAKL